MNKIFFICDGSNFSEGALAFIKSFCENEQVFVKGFSARQLILSNRFR